jgi:phosphatidylserine/phosphatidylglycerophosphate/cardiolipin synthase-like enzyme
MSTLRRLSVVLLAGMFLGIILGVEVVHLADENVCPQSVCLDKDSVVPFSDRGFFPVVHEALSKAKKSIHIVAYELKYYPDYVGSSENVIIEDLAAAHDRGVEVLILVDDGSVNNSAVGYLRKQGITVKYDSKEAVTHAKLVIIDEETVILGSTNFTYYGLEKNNEVDVLVVSARVAAYFEDYFKDLWGG